MRTCSRNTATFSPGSISASASFAAARPGDRSGWRSGCRLRRSTTALSGRLARTLRRYCDHRIRYNRREGQAQRLCGVSALRIGVPVTAVGLAVTVAATKIRPSTSAANIITDHIGWVLAWIGLWFPIDQFLFSPLAYRGESRVLRLLARAEIDVQPHRPGTDAERP